MLNRMEGTPRRRSGFTLIELLVVVAIIALLISILLPSLARARELSKRTVCSTNLKQLGTACYTYGNENQESWPVPNPYAAAAAALPGGGQVTYVQAMGGDLAATAGTSLSRGSLNNTEAGNPSLLMPAAGTYPAGVKMSTTRGFWMLIRNNAATPKQFGCPSSEDVPNNEDNPQAFWDFGDNKNLPANTFNQADPSSIQKSVAATWPQCSYGYQVPFGSNGRPNSDRDQRMPLAADKGPWGTFTDGGKGSDPATNPSTPTWATITVTSGPDDWRKFNSPNHGGVGDGEGEVVLYADSHADFQTKPLAGIGQDNIYTAWSVGAAAGPTTDQIVRGTSPTQNPSSPTAAVPSANTDTILYP